MSPSEFQEIIQKNPRQSSEKIRAYFGRISKASGLSKSAVRMRYYRNRVMPEKAPEVDLGKETEFVDWRDYLGAIKHLQKVKKSNSSEVADVKIDTDKPICLIGIGDTQIGSWGTDYDLFMRMTDEIVNTPNLYVVLIGDILQLAIKLRGVAEVQDNIIPSGMQYDFLDSWLSEIGHKLLGATWCNHGPMREERGIGYSPSAAIYKKHTHYFNGIGHINLQVGKQTYKVALTHFFRGRSMYNPVHGVMRYMREMANHIELGFAGDSHVPGMMKYTEGGNTRVALNCGSIQTNSGYAKRLFSLNTYPVFPCAILDPNEHVVTPFWSVREWLNIQNNS